MTEKFTSEVVKRFVTKNDIWDTVIYEPRYLREWRLSLRIQNNDAYAALKAACESMDIPAIGQPISHWMAVNGGVIHLKDTKYLSILTLIGGITHIDEYVNSPDDITELEKFYNMSVTRIVFICGDTKTVCFIDMREIF